MNKELQDLVWSILPKEFKEEVKKIFYTHENNEIKTYLIHLFGLHNLTSDAEGEEEMLFVSRKRLLDAFNSAKIIGSSKMSSKMLAGAADMCINTFNDLFGSKCLPEETCNVASPEANVKSLAMWQDEDDPDIAQHLAFLNSLSNEHSESQPAGPKYGSDDKVTLNGYGGFVITSSYLDPYTREYKYRLGGFKGHFCESDLELYTEPKNKDSEFIRAESVKEARIADEETHLRNLSQETANCDKHFDNILKDSFRNHNRLQIAAMAMQAILISEHREHATLSPKEIAQLSLEYAEALIAEIEKKGGDNENN